MKAWTLLSHVVSVITLLLSQRPIIINFLNNLNISLTKKFPINGTKCLSELIVENYLVGIQVTTFTFVGIDITVFY